jgi:hypothetical protein
MPLTDDIKGIIRARLLGDPKFRTALGNDVVEGYLHGDNGISDHVSREYLDDAEEDVIRSRA